MKGVHFTAAGAAVLCAGSLLVGLAVAKKAGAAQECTPAVMVVRHAEDGPNPNGGADVLSAAGKRHAALYPLLFRKYLAKTHSIGPGGADVSVCPIGKIIAIDPNPNPENRSPGSNPYETIKPLAEHLGLPIEVKDAAGVAYSTVYNWDNARRKTLLDNGSSTPTSKALPTDEAAIVGSGAYYTPQRTDFYVFSLQDPDTGKFGFAKAYKQWFSDDGGLKWYYRTALLPTDKPDDIAVGKP